MPNKNKNQIFYLVFGIVVGVAVVAISSLFFHKAVKGFKTLKRYEAKLPPDLKAGLKLFTASSLDRIFQDGKTSLKPSFSDSASLSLAKNEYESFQVVVSASRDDLKSVWLDISDLVSGATGAKISKGNISWRVVGYVPTKQPYYPVKFVGPWPDPLLPAQKTDIEKGTTQPFWVTVYLLQDILAGDYQGTIEIKADGISPQRVPFSVHVYDFVLPKESHLKTAFDFYGHITKSRYPQGENEGQEAYQARLDSLNDRFTIEMLKYRMNPILNIDPTSQGELGRVDRYRVYGLNNFSVGKKGGTFGNNWPSSSQEIENLFSLYRTYGEDLKLNRMLPYTYIYTWDEGDIGNPRVAKICSMIHRAYPGLKNMVCYHGFWNPEKNPEWGKDIDIWCFQLDTFNEEKMKNLQKIGKEIWMYASGPSGNGVPNLVIDFDSMDYRIIPWLCWKYDIKGFLYWCVNWWPRVDPFKSAKNTDWEQNGNGLLFYPGNQGPLASLRSEIFRDGMEDYEYIQLLMQKIKELKKRKLEAGHEDLINQSIKIMTVDNSIAESMSKFTKDGDVLKIRRGAIAKKIEEFGKLLAEQNAAAPTQEGNAASVK